MGASDADRAAPKSVDAICKTSPSVGTTMTPDAESCGRRAADQWLRVLSVRIGNMKQNGLGAVVSNLLVGVL